MLLATGCYKPSPRLPVPVCVTATSLPATAVEADGGVLYALVDLQLHMLTQAGQHLQLNGPSAAAYYWLGLLCDAAGKGDQACAYYRKAIYLEPQHREALTHLAAHLEAQGDQSGAQRLYRRAQNPEVGERD